MIDIHDFPDLSSPLRFFEEISAIPHGSGNCSAIADYLVSFAKERSLTHMRDAADNVIIKKPATEGYEDRPTVIIQGHTDMVAEKLATLAKDMKTEGLELVRDGDFLRAVGTTLGGDDGIAVAYALALLDSDDIPHPALEALFTSDEEIGLLGASAVDPAWLDGRIMINVDSDEEGVFTVGCAGGVRVDIALDVKSATCDTPAYSLSVSGLLGGHSGIEIDKNRSNAIKLTAELLSTVEGARRVKLEGGNADNAIPRDAYAVFTAPSLDKESFKAAADNTVALLQASEPSVSVRLEDAEEQKSALDLESTRKVLSVINEIKSSVILMSKDIEGLVDTSENLGVARISESGAAITVSIRSTADERKEAQLNTLRTVAKEHGAALSTRGSYPGWAYKQDSVLRDTCVKVYKETYGKAPEVITIHAGLECGIFAGKLKGLDCISIGPDNFDIHTTEEHLSLSSSERVWGFIKNVLKEIR